MLNRIVKWFNGYLVVRLTKGSPERFFNVCRKRNIFIWDINIENTNYIFKIKLSDYKKINDISFKCKTYPKQINRIGFPFVFDSLIKKRTLLPAFTLFLITLIYLSGFVWDISVSGQNRYTKEALTEYLSTIGLNQFMRKNKLDADRLEKQLRIDYKDIGWVSVSLIGTNVYVKILESDLPDTKETDNNYSNLIASDDGVVKSIVTRTGIPMVHEGDKVKKGQVLVSGIIDLYNDSGEIYKKNPVKADADIILEVRKKYRNMFSLIYDAKYYTGRSKTEYTICSENNIINLENILNKFESYEKYDIINENVLFNIMSKKRIYEYEIVSKTYTKKEALDLAKNNLTNYLRNKYSENTKILDTNINVKIKDGICDSAGWIDMHILQNKREQINYKDWGVEQTNEQHGNEN